MLSYGLKSESDKMKNQKAMESIGSMAFFKWMY